MTRATGASIRPKAGHCRCPSDSPAWAVTCALISLRWNLQFYPVRNKRSENPHVFGFRIIAGTVGSFATTEKVKNANSLAFVEGRADLRTVLPG